MNKLSYTKYNLYLDCPKKFNLYYNQRLRSNQISSALIFGTAIDAALNDLLINKDLVQAENIFYANFKYRKVNGATLDIETSDRVVFMDNDLDVDLLNPEDKLKSNKQFWSLFRKGIIIIESYNEFFIPKVKEVLALQQKIEIKNDQGDVIEGYLDLIVRLNDDKVYLLDHKTSSKPYDKDSAEKSTQLNLYSYLQTTYKLDGIGFVVLNKNIWKKKVKICSKCQFDGSGTSFRTCNNLFEAKRCSGEWNITLDAKCFIDLILDKPSTEVTNMVLDSFDGVNQQIKNKAFHPNLNSCKKGKFVCDYYDYCYNGDSSKLTQVPERKE